MWSMGWGWGGLNPIPAMSYPSEGGKILKIQSNWYATFILKKDGSLWYWGNASGDDDYTLTPAQIVESGVVDFYPDAEGALLFIKSDGSLWGMGDNSYGQLGLGKI